MASRGQTRGLIILNTGKGKGKTTAAIGTLLRAWGHGMRTCVIQFIKREGVLSGEALAAERLGIEWHQMGTGFTWESDDLEECAEKARDGWSLAQERISSAAYDLVILDEFTYPLSYGWLDVAEVVSWLEARKPQSLHLIITGRDAPGPIVELADLVTEMRNVRHPYDYGVAAQKGIEF
jgi:cob(I)alamin adenosyltransferase